MSGFVVMPAVDIADGRVVHLTQGATATATTYGDPIATALAYQEQGAKWLHLADLDAAFGRGDNRDLIAEVVAKLEIAVDLSGGVRDDTSLQAALESGAARVTIATAALENPNWVVAAITNYGERVAVGLDVQRSMLRGRGSTRPGGELFHTIARLDAEGCNRYVCTDVQRDGTMTGPNLHLLRSVCTVTDRPVIASGGVSTLDDLHALVALEAIGVEGVTVGTALHSGVFTLPEAFAAVDTITGPSG